MKKLSITCILALAIYIVANAQVPYNAASAKIEIAGTSTLHDWSMASNKANCNASFAFDGASLVRLSSLSFILSAESIKSDHTAMDKNAYKALHTVKFPQISFNCISANVHSNGPNTYIISANGNLAISGVKKDVHLESIAKVNPADLSISTSGSFKIKMSDFNVERPSVMFGTVKVGDEITVNYNVVLKK
jgi:polyisoprenoid-binding protein YceI